MNGDILPFLGSLCLYYTYGLSIYKQEVVDCAGVGVKFAHSNTRSGGRVEVLPILHQPTGLAQLCINNITSLLLWGHFFSPSSGILK
jgi:hypothetical protein